MISSFSTVFLTKTAARNAATEWHPSFALLGLGLRHDAGGHAGGGLPRRPGEAALGAGEASEGGADAPGGAARGAVCGVDLPKFYMDMLVCHRGYLQWD